MRLLIDFSGKGGNQYWEYNGEIYRDNYCMTYDAHDLVAKHCRKTDKQVSQKGLGPPPKILNRSESTA